MAKSFTIYFCITRNLRIDDAIAYIVRVIMCHGHSCLNVVKAGYGVFLSFFKENPFSFFVLVDKDDLFSSDLTFILNM